MNWKELIKRLLVEHDLSIHGFSKRTGMNHVTVQKIMNGVTEEIQQKTKHRIERAFQISINDDDPENLTVTANPQIAKSITELTENLIEKYSPQGNYILGTVTAGTGTVLDFEQKMVEQLEYPVDTCFWYVIDKQNGDSMYPLLVESDKVLVDRAFPQKRIKETDMVLVEYSGRGAIKFFSRSEHDANILVFYSANGAVPPLILRKEDCEYFKVVLIKKI